MVSACLACSAGCDDGSGGGETVEAELIDAATRGRLLERFGPRAIGWCEGLPAQIERLAWKWGFRVVRPISNGNTACVFVCERSDDEAAVVLKLSPDRSLLKDEAAALAAWRDSGRVPRVLGVDGEGGALLMEFIRPGTMLADGPAADRLTEVAGLVRGLHAAASGEDGAGFPPLVGLVEFFFAFWGEQLRKPAAAAVVPRELLERSRVVARDLSTRPGRRVLLHGDLHPRNVLDGGRDRGLVAIDPRARVGDPAFDLIDWVFCGGGDEGELARRAGWLAEEADVDSDSLWRWCGCIAVLEAIRRLVREGDSADDVHPLLALAGDQV